MNILQMEDMVKGLPDQQLFQEAQMPSGQIPQFLTISEIQRRTEMRKRYAAQQPQPEGTVSEQIVQQGIAGLAPQGAQPPIQQMASGGQVQGMAAGGRTLNIPFTQGDITRMLQFAPVGTDMETWQAFLAGQLEPTSNEQIPYREETPVQFDSQGNLIGQGSPEIKSRMFEDIPGGITGLGPELGYYGDAYGNYLSGLREEPLNIRRHAGAAMDLWMPQIEGLGESAWDTARKVGITTKELGRGVASQLGFETDEGPFTRGPMGDVERLEMLGAMFDKDSSDPLLDEITVDAERMQPAGGGIADVGAVKKGGTGAQTQATNDARELMGPPAPDGDLVDEADTLSALERLLGMDVKAPGAPDMSAQIAEARKDAMNSALIQLGAGIASDDIGGGIRNAGIAAMQGRQSARDLESQMKLLDYKSDIDDIDREIGRLYRAGTIEASAVRSVVDRAIEGGRSERALRDAVLKLAMELYPEESYLLNPQKRAEDIEGYLRSALPEHLWRGLLPQGKPSSKIDRGNMSDEEYLDLLLKTYDR